jgi:glycosyltransferase involved in cell wall biosynthesis
VLQLHNLHGLYFDLRELPRLSQALPTVLTLHDAWLISGHCAHSLECDRWTHGCGRCPDLRRYPEVHRDGTAFNWRRKERLFAKSTLYVNAPSRWLMRYAERSMLAPAMVEARVIPTGVDRSVFLPRPKRQVRAELGLPEDASILLFVANALRRNPYKDYATIVDTLARLACSPRERPLILIALGDSGPFSRIGDAEIRFVPHLQDPSDVAPYYQAADVYLHAARADTFPRVVLEALACGLPVVATGVAGIPEQIRSLDEASPTGIVVPPQNPGAMAAAVERLIGDDSLRAALGANAVRDVADRFDLERQADTYQEWYREIVEKRGERT